jgi:signal transduction histidine kinase
MIVRFLHLLPRRTVRLRLTLLFGSLFLVSGVGLLAITYVLVGQASPGVVSYEGNNGLTGTIDGPPNMNGTTQRVDVGPNVSDSQREDPATVARTASARAKSAQMHELLAQSGIALAIMAVVSVVLGWIIAGRILSRLRTITATARDISATNLHRRLALDGPDDELKEMGDTFDDLLARLEASFRAQRQFVANASHELRTPLTRQRVLSQVALSDPDATVQSLRAAHRRVLVAGAQQERLIEALLTLARGQGGFEVREPFDLASLTEQALATRRPEALSRGLTLRAGLAPAPAAGDPRLAERLITNLVDNALRHNVPDGMLEVITGVEHGRPVLHVTNTGPEVPEPAIERLFQPFQRLGSERTSKAEGLGLGLSIVQAIAKAHDATVDARPRLGGGLSLKVTFPARDTAAAAKARTHSVIPAV